MYRLCVCDKLVFCKPALGVWVCATALNEVTDGISAEPANLDVTEKSEPPLSDWMPSWSDDDPSWGACVTGLAFAPKLAWCVLCTRMIRRKSEGSTSIMDAFCVVSLRPLTFLCISIFCGAYV